MAPAAASASSDDPKVPIYVPYQKLTGKRELEPSCFMPLLPSCLACCAASWSTKDKGQHWAQAKSKDEEEKELTEGALSILLQ